MGRGAGHPEAPWAHGPPAPRLPVSQAAEGSSRPTALWGLRKAVGRGQHTAHGCTGWTGRLRTQPWADGVTITKAGAEQAGDLGSAEAAWKPPHRQGTPSIRRHSSPMQERGWGDGIWCLSLRGQGPWGQQVGTAAGRSCPIRDSRSEHAHTQHGHTHGRTCRTRPRAPAAAPTSGPGGAGVSTRAPSGFASAPGQGLGHTWAWAWGGLTRRSAPWRWTGSCSPCWP